MQVVPHCTSSKCVGSLQRLNIEVSRHGIPIMPLCRREACISSCINQLLLASMYCHAAQLLRPALRMACPRTGHYRMASFFRTSFQIPFFFILFLVIVFLLNISIIIVVVFVVFVMTLPACFFLELTILKCDVTHRMRGHLTATTATVTSAQYR